MNSKCRVKHNLGCCHGWCVCGTQKGALEQLIVLLFRGGADRALKGLESVMIKFNNPSLYLDWLGPSFLCKQQLKLPRKTTESRAALIKAAACGLGHKPGNTAFLLQVIRTIAPFLLHASRCRLRWGKSTRRAFAKSL